MKTCTSYRDHNIALLEAFGRLDKLCGECFAQPYGVTLYISEMESLKNTAAPAISDFDSDLQRLKTVRHKRNRLAHGEIPFDLFCAEAADVQFCDRLYQSILQQRDPLSLYERSAAQSVSLSDTKGSKSSAKKKAASQMCNAVLACIRPSCSKATPSPSKERSAAQSASLRRKSTENPRQKGNGIVVFFRIFLVSAALLLLLSLLFRCRPL